MKRIEAGEMFSIVDEKTGRRDTFRREADDPSPVFESEPFRVTHLTSCQVPGMTPYTFSAEVRWFTNRGFVPATGVRCDRCGGCGIEVVRYSLSVPIGPPAERVVTQRCLDCATEAERDVWKSFGILTDRPASEVIR